MKSALLRALSAALERMVVRHPSAEEAYVPLSDAMRFAALAKVEARQMCGVKPSDDTLLISLTTSDPAPVLALSDLSMFERCSGPTASAQPRALGRLT